MITRRSTPSKVIQKHLLTLPVQTSPHSTDFNYLGNQTAVVSVAIGNLPVVSGSASKFVWNMPCLFNQCNSVRPWGSRFSGDHFKCQWDYQCECKHRASFAGTQWSAAGSNGQQQSREVVEINSGRNVIYGTSGLLTAHYQTSADCCGQR